MQLQLNLLTNEIYERLSNSKNKKLNYDLIRFNRKVSQINLIITRIVKNTKEHRRLENKVWDTKLPDNEKRPYMQKHGKLSSYIQLDTEDYFIHVQILMDKIATLIASYVQELPRKQITSFAEIINYFKNNRSNNEILQYVYDQEKWFILLINVHRNNMIIHDHFSEFSGASYSMDKLHSPIRIVFPNEEEGKHITEQLNQIKTNHLEDISEFRNETNIWKLLLLCDYNAENLSYEEINIVKSIHKTHGGELPQIDFVNQKLQSFLDNISIYLKSSSINNT